MKKSIWISGVIILAVVALLVIPKSGASSYESIDSFNGDVEIYKSFTCGCCGIYSNYFDSKTDTNFEVFNLAEIESLKIENEIPRELWSCHTTFLKSEDGKIYYVEGHIPLEAVEKLLSEQPDIAGVAMPGMPSGSPGMPGQKYGDFVIYAVNHDGTYDEFMRI